MTEIQNNKINPCIDSSNLNVDISNQTNTDDILDKVYKMRFNDRTAVKVCEKIDQLFYYLSTEEIVSADASAIKSKIKSGILRLKVLKADIEAKHYEERLTEHKKKNRTILIIILALAVGLPLLLLIIDHLTGGEFFAMPEIKLPF